MATEAGPGRAPLALLVVVSDAADPDLGDLLASVERCNADRLPVHVMTPEDLGVGSVDEVPLAFWQDGACDLYWAVDARTRFIRPFRGSDLIHPSGRPYAFLTEDAERAVDPATSASWRTERAGLALIRAEVGLTDPRVLSARHSVLYSTAVVESLYRDFLMPRGMTYADLLAVVPDASGWYSAWLQVADPDAYVAREPIVLDLDSENRYLQMALRQETAEALSRSYVAVRLLPPHQLDDATPGTRLSRAELVGEHARPGELLRAAWLRIYRQLPSLQRLVARLRRA